MQARALVPMGRVDQVRQRRLAKGLFNVDNLLEKAEAARERREAAGIADSVEAVQPLKAPKFDSKLVGKRVEVLWPYKHEGQTLKIWASGTVKRVADGLSDRRGKKGSILPAGALLWAWDEDKEYDEKAGERWLVLLPAKYNKQVQYAWRFDSWFPRLRAGA